MKNNFKIISLLSVIFSVLIYGNFVFSAPAQFDMHLFVVAEHCTNAVQDVDEAGVDCGGAECAYCANHCESGVQDADETGVDCGGGDCSACVIDHCVNGIKDFDETGVDCGGGSCSACAIDHCINGIKDADETGIDCGGATCTACIPIVIPIIPPGTTSTVGGGGLLEYDSVAVRISDVRVPEIDSYSARIEWKTDKLAVCQVFLGKTTDYEILGLAEMSFLTDHSAWVNYLSPKTLYNFKIKCRNRSTVYSETGNYSFSSMPRPSSVSPIVVPSDEVKKPSSSIVKKPVVPKVREVSEPVNKKTEIIPVVVATSTLGIPPVTSILEKSENAIKNLANEILGEGEEVGEKSGSDLVLPIILLMVLLLVIAVVIIKTLLKKPPQVKK